jgi:hypothetical protein
MAVVMRRVMMCVRVAMRMVHQMMVPRMGVVVGMVVCGRESGRGQQRCGQGDDGQGCEKTTH